MKALIFDLDGTLVDSVYAHVLAWQLAFAEAGMWGRCGVDPAYGSTAQELPSNEI